MLIGKGNQVAKYAIAQLINPQQNALQNGCID